MAGARRACVITGLVFFLLFIVTAFLAARPLLLSYAFYGTINPCSDPPVIKVEGPVLVVGDIHFKGFWEEQFAGLKSLILDYKVRVLVLNGDLYDSPGVFWGLASELGAEDALRETLATLGIHGLNLTIIYIEGSRGHDPELEKLISLLDSRYVSHGYTLTLHEDPCIALHVDEIRAIVTHGDKAFDAYLAHFINRITGKPLMESLWRSVVDLDEDTWTIFSHTHVPGIDETSKTVNTGSWERTPILSPEIGTGVLIVGDQVELVKTSDS